MARTQKVFPPDAGSTNAGNTPAIGSSGRGIPRTGDIRHIGNVSPRGFYPLSFSRTDLTAVAAASTIASATAFTGVKVGALVTITGMFAAGNNGTFLVTAVSSDSKTLTLAASLTDETPPLAVTGTDIAVTAATKTISDSSENFTTICKAGDTILCAGFSHSGNNGTKTVASVTANAIVLSASTGLVDESAGQSVTITRTTAETLAQGSTGYQPLVLTPGTIAASDSPNQNDSVQADENGGALPTPKDSQTTATTYGGLDGADEGKDDFGSKAGKP